jgi:hypothetical protein
MKSIDPLQWVLPGDDPGYAEALAARAAHPEQYSRLDGLYGSMGCVWTLQRSFSRNMGADWTCWCRVCLALVVLRYLEHVIFRVCSGRGPKKLLSARYVPLIH